MEYVKYLKNVGRANSAKLALWIALIAMAIVAGIAALGPGLS